MRWPKRPGERRATTRAVRRVANLERRFTDTSAGMQWAYIAVNASKVCPASATTQLDADPATFYTNAASLFDVQTNGSGNHGIRLLGDGHFLSIFMAGCVTPPTAGTHYEMQQIGGGSAGSFELPPTNILIPTSPLTDDSRVSEGLIMTVGDSTSAPTNPIVASIVVTAAHAVTIATGALFVLQLDATAIDLG